LKGAFLLILGLLVSAPLMAASPVHLRKYLDVDDARLYMAIQGASDDAPLLIWLHGGPGGAERPLFRLYNASLERRFVVVYLDQRGTGRSFDRKSDPGELTIARHVADLHAVIDDLLEEFGTRQVVLVGHSWGSALGLLYVQKHPEEIAAFVGAGQVTSEIARQWSQYRFVEAQARERGELDSLTRIEAIGPPPFTVAHELDIQRLVERYGGYWRNPPGRLKLAAKAALRGYAMPWELPRLIKGNNVSLHAMNDELLKLDLRERVQSVEVPVIFMLGRYDRQVDSCLASDYFEQLSAPEKRLKWFDTAHNIPFEAPEAFDDSLVQLLESVGVHTVDASN
jgi:pimeloyl-ACP methyl ester carboxylesterase